jgi:RNA polymerase sigma-70 factor (ECF subfamily)
MEHGTREAWVEAALARYEQPLLRYALRFTHNAEQARDAVQDTFLKLCMADPAKVDDHLAAWLYTVCRNHALSQREKEARMTPLGEKEMGMAGAADVGATASRNETHERVLDVVAGLPPNQQEAFQLKFRDGLNYREISGAMGVSIGTVSNLITAALNVIRQELRADIPRAQEAQS